MRAAVSSRDSRSVVARRRAAPDVDLVGPVLLAGGVLGEPCRSPYMRSLARGVNGQQVVLASVATDLGPFTHAGFVLRHPVLHLGGVLEDRGFSAAVFGRAIIAVIWARMRVEVDFVNREVGDGTTAVSGFVNAFGGQGDVDPAGEEFRCVPHRVIGWRIKMSRDLQVPQAVHTKAGHEGGAQAATERGQHRQREDAHRHVANEQQNEGFRLWWCALRIPAVSCPPVGELYPPRLPTSTAAPRATLLTDLLE